MEHFNNKWLNSFIKKTFPSLLQWVALPGIILFWSVIACLSKFVKLWSFPCWLWRSSLKNRLFFWWVWLCSDFILLSWRLEYLFFLVYLLFWLLQDVGIFFILTLPVLHASLVGISFFELWNFSLWYCSKYFLCFWPLPVIYIFDLFVASQSYCMLTLFLGLFNIWHSEWSNSFILSSNPNILSSTWLPYWWDFPKFFCTYYFTLNFTF